MVLPLFGLFALFPAKKDAKKDGAASFSTSRSLLLLASAREGGSFFGGFLA
jgi:hypothetical protein